MDTPNTLTAILSDKNRIQFISSTDDIVREVDERIFTVLTKSTLPIFTPDFQKLIEQVYTNQITQEDFLEQFLRKALTND